MLILLEQLLRKSMKSFLGREVRDLWEERILSPDSALS
ncbi:hypothetical protein HMPREF1145_2142 [Oribacterium parvum ACB8]|nr:hypothetical protein HMPREF1145_2142 [Oribacterium parvum ACB8]